MPSPPPPQPPIRWQMPRRHHPFKRDTIKTNSTATNDTHFLTFVADNNGSATAETLFTDGGITYNPSTDTLSVTNITAR